MTTPTPASCPPHHWSLPAANGPTATGVCLFCGAVQARRNGWIGDDPEQAGANKRKSPPRVGRFEKEEGE